MKVATRSGSIPYDGGFQKRASPDQFLKHLPRFDAGPAWPPMKLPIRVATIDDVPAIVAMRDRLNALELANCPHASIEPLTVAQFAERWGPTFGHPDYHWQIAEDDGRAVGFGLIYLTLPVTEPPHAFLHW